MFLFFFAIFSFLYFKRIVWFYFDFYSRQSQRLGWKYSQINEQEENVIDGRMRSIIFIRFFYYGFLGGNKKQ